MNEGKALPLEIERVLCATDLARARPCRRDWRGVAMQITHGVGNLKWLLLAAGTVGVFAQRENHPEVIP